MNKRVSYERELVECCPQCGGELYENERGDVHCRNCS